MRDTRVTRKDGSVVFVIPRRHVVHMYVCTCVYACVYVRARTSRRNGKSTLLRKPFVILEIKKTCLRYLSGNARGDIDFPRMLPRGRKYTGCIRRSMSSYLQIG